MNANTSFEPPRKSDDILFDSKILPGQSRHGLKDPTIISGEPKLQHLFLTVFSVQMIIIIFRRDSGQLLHEVELQLAKT